MTRLEGRHSTGVGRDTESKGDIRRDLEGENGTNGNDIIRISHVNNVLDRMRIVSIVYDKRNVRHTATLLRISVTPTKSCCEFHSVPALKLTSFFLSAAYKS